MIGKQFDLNDLTMSVIEELGGHMPGGFFIYRAQAPEELLYANKPVFDIYGCDGPEDFKRLTGFTFRGMVHPEDYAAVSASIAAQIADRADHMDYSEYRIIRKDGAVRWVDDYGHYVVTESYGGIYTVFISDITEKHERIQSDLADQRAAIEALNKYVARMHAEHITFSRIAQALARDYFITYVVDPDTEMYVEYSAAEEYTELGFEKAGEDFFSMCRRNVERIIFPEDRERFLGIFTRERVLSILERDGSFTMKFRLMLRSAPVYVSLKATLLDDEHGRHLIIGMNNIDAQMKRELAFQKKLSEAKDRAKNDFLANISHDIRTPMNAIVGYTNIANANLDDPVVIRDSLEKISSSSHFLLSLINDVLDMSKIESGKMQLSLGSCDLASIFRRIEDITSLQARSKELNISYDKSGVRHFHVIGDELRIEQIVINIVSNAIKYTPAGKDVALIVEELGLRENGKARYRIIVRDTGIGISEDYLPHIFDSFTREQSTLVNRTQGTGLGLAITARIVEQRGGTISVRSKLGEGSEFTVELDLTPAEPAGAEAEEAGDLSRALAGRRLLLVEDNDINAEIAVMLLGEYGLEVDRAENGRIGLELLQKAGPGRYDAVLMDIQMPVMNGYDATRAIRALPDDWCRSLPIIAMSANAYDDDVRNCLEAGMNGHVAKPFQPEDLLKLLHSFLRSAG